MNDIELLKKITISDLSEPYNEYAEIIGIESLIKISEAFGGIAIYMPDIEGLLYNTKVRLIQEEFDGYNYYELAKKYGYSSTRTVWEIVKNVKLENRASYIYKQIKRPNILNYEKLLKKAKIEDFQYPYNEYAKLIGIENLYKLCMFTPSIGFYIPQIKTIVKPFRNGLIKKEFNGGNYGELALKYKVSERSIRVLINGK